MSGKIFFAPNSPDSADLHFTENLWSILKGGCEETPQNLEDLETFALEEFYAIPEENVQKLFQVNKKSIHSYKF